MDTSAARAALTERRDDLVRELEVLTAIERDTAATVSFGKRVGDGTTAAVDRLNQVGQADQLQAMLVDVDRALEKIEDGTYGICDRCGRSIPEERLQARPWSVLCVDCASLVGRRA